MDPDSLRPNDLESYAEPDGGVRVEISDEGVCALPGVPRKGLVLVPVEVLERMLTEMYGKGREDEAEWTRLDKG